MISLWNQSSETSPAAERPNIAGRRDSETLAAKNSVALERDTESRGTSS